MKKDSLDRNPKFSKAGFIVVGIILLLAGASLMLLCQRQRRVEEFNIAARVPSWAAEPGVLISEGSQRIDFTASPSVIAPGRQQVELEWDIPDAESVTVEGLPGSFDSAGSYTLRKGHPLLARARRGGDVIISLKAKMKDGGEREATTVVSSVGNFLEGGGGGK